MIGERLKELRNNGESSQRELAAAIGVQTSMISRYEYNRDDLCDKVKVKIVRFLDISLDYLLGVIDDPVAYHKQSKFVILQKELSDTDRFSLSELLAYLYCRSESSHGVSETAISK